MSVASMDSLSSQDAETDTNSPRNSEDQGGGAPSLSVQRSSNKRRIVLGICAMDKKTSAKPMREILGRLPTEDFEVIIFGNATILDEPVEKWPRCGALLSFFSTNFPLEKAEAYVALLSLLATD
jgi:inositol-hexakisphosphate/diphosphoinositol-pentakisphosphate 1-kinase